MKSIALLQLATLGAGYEAVQISTLRPEIEVLDFIPLGKESQLLLKGSFEGLQNFRKTIRTADLQKSVILENAKEVVLNSYYHLENNKPEDFILIFESEFAGYLLEALSSLLSHNLKVMDFRQPRFSGAISSLVVTGKDSSRIEKLIFENESHKWKISFVENPTEKMKAFFQIKAE